jgi:hypothetical protein
LRLRSGSALPSAQAPENSLILIVGLSHLDCRAAARLGSQPSTLFAAVGKLTPGAYSLAWRAKARDGEISTGNIPFQIAPR